MSFIHTLDLDPANKKLAVYPVGNAYLRPFRYILADLRSTEARGSTALRAYRFLPAFY